VLAYEKLGNRAKAVEAYQSAVSLNPGNGDARAGLTRLSAS
jgi:Tfp pilus assembly protein PilF